MADNFPGPFEVRIFYSVGGLTHVMKVNCKVDSAPVPGADPSTITLLNRGGNTVPLLASVADFVATLQDVHSVDTDFDYAELWEYPPQSRDGTFITAWSLAVSGTVASTIIPAQQHTLTFRTQEGGVMKLVILESAFEGSGRISGSNDIAPFAGVWSYVDADTGWLLARDTSWPIAKIRRSDGQNEAIFRRRYR